MNILAVETSCDETAVAILQCEGGIDAPEFSISSNALYSQAEEHAAFGGVYPNIAKREHANNLVPLLEKAVDAASLSKTTNTLHPDTSKWEKASKVLHKQTDLYTMLRESHAVTSLSDIDAVAVTVGPGLEPALWIGLNLAKALAILADVPLVPVNHLEAHMLTPLVSRSSVPVPAVALIISGGHTQLIHMKDYFEYTLLGQTQDDAVGEAFDKVARMLDLGYPGGPAISKLAKQARDANLDVPESLTLPRPIIDTEDFHFSFSGLKTAVRYTIEEIQKDNKQDIFKKTKMAIARAFEEAVADVLKAKTKKALAKHTPHSLILGGGVVANRYLRSQFTSLMHNRHNTELILPPDNLATDNAVMIGVTGYLRFENGDYIQNNEGIVTHKADGRHSLT